MAAMIRAVLFDLDGTLLDRETCVRHCVEDQFQRFADRLAPVRLADFRERFRQLEEHGYVPKEAVYQQMGVEFGFSPRLREALTADYFLAYPAFCVGFRHMLETLRLLRDRGLKLAIVTNASSSFQRAAIAALKIEHLFDAIVISEAEGVSKPDRRIFDLTLSRLGVAAGDAIFVGDHPDVDVRGAQEAGMRAIWKHDEYWGACPHADAAITELNQLTGILDRFDADRA